MHKQVRINTNTSAGRAPSKDALERAPCQLNVTDMFSTEKGEKKEKNLRLFHPPPPTDVLLHLPQGTASAPAFKRRMSLLNYPQPLAALNAVQRVA